MHAAAMVIPALKMTASKLLDVPRETTPMAAMSGTWPSNLSDHGHVPESGCDDVDRRSTPIITTSIRNQIGQFSNVVRR
jgi:hypothetical protein